MGRQSEGVSGGGVYCWFGEGQGIGGAFVPGGPLVEEPGAGGVGGLAEDEIECGVVEVGEVGGESLGGAEGAAYLFDCAAIAALRLDAGSDGEADDALEEGRLAEDGMLDIHGAGFAVLPSAEVGGCMGFLKAFVDGIGEEVVPVGVVFREPAGGGVHDELLFGVGLFAPGVEERGVAGIGAELWVEKERPESVASGDDDGGG